MSGPNELATRSSRLVLGLPHTNRDGLAEHLLLMHAGHLYLVRDRARLAAQTVEPSQRVGRGDLRDVLFHRRGLSRRHAALDVPARR